MACMIPGLNAIPIMVGADGKKLTFVGIGERDVTAGGMTQTFTFNFPAANGIALVMAGFYRDGANSGTILAASVAGVGLTKQTEMIQDFTPWISKRSVCSAWYAPVNFGAGSKNVILDVNEHNAWFERCAVAVYLLEGFQDASPTATKTYGRNGIGTASGTIAAQSGGVIIQGAMTQHTGEALVFGGVDADGWDTRLTAGSKENTVANASYAISSQQVTGSGESPMAVCAVAWK